MKGISKTLTKLVYTSKQREALELFFLSLPMPPLEERQRIEELSETTGLSRDQIKMWIRNRRNRGAYKGRVNLAIEQVSVLEWIFINITTYPSVSLKHLLASELDIRYDQIQKWFETRRLRGPPAILSRASNMDEEEWQRTVQRIHELVLLSKSDENEPKRKGVSHAQSNILSPKRKNRGESPDSKMFKRSRLEATRVAESPAYDQIQNRTHSEASFSVPASNFFADSMYHQPSHSSTSSLANSQPLPHRFDVFQSPSQPQHPQQQSLATSSLASSSASTTSLPSAGQFFSRSQSTTPLDYRNLKQQQQQHLHQTPLLPSSTPSTSTATTPSFSIGSPSPSPSNIPVSPYSNPFLSPPLPPLSSLIQDLHLSTTPNSSPMNSPSLASLSSAPPPPSASPSPTPSLGGSSSSSATTPNGTPSLTVASGAGMASNPLASQSTPLPLLAPWRPYLSSSNGFFQE